MTRRIEYCALQLHEMWARGDSREEIAAALGCSASLVNKLALRHKLQRRQRPVKEILDNDPTPDKIERWKALFKERHLEEKRLQQWT